MPRGSKIDRMHRAIARNIGGPNASGRSWAVMQSRGMAKRVGKHMRLTTKTRRTTRRKR